MPKKSKTICNFKITDADMMHTNIKSMLERQSKSKERKKKSKINETAHTFKSVFMS